MFRSFCCDLNKIWSFCGNSNEIWNFRGDCFFSFFFLTSICCTVRSKNVKSLLTGITLFGPWHPIEVPKPPFSFTTTSLFNIARISSLFVGSCRLLYSLTAPSGSFSIRFQSTDGPSSAKNRPKRDAKLFISSLNPSFFSSGAVWIKLSNSHSSWRNASRFVTSWNSLASLGTRECVRFWGRKKKLINKTFFLTF